jgi:hypothetical protein
MPRRNTSIPVCAIGNNELDRYGLWRIAVDERQKLVIDRLAAIRHALPPELIGMGILLFGVPLGVREWIRQRLAHPWPSFVNQWLDALLLLGLVAVFLPTLIVRCLQVARVVRAGSWLQVDHARQEIRVRLRGLRIPFNQLEWSVEYVQGYSEGQLCRRAQLILRFETLAGWQTHPVTARYGRNALSRVKRLAREYAAFTCSTVALQPETIP